MKKLLTLVSAVTAIVAAVPETSHANVVITGTRVVYRQSDREVTVKLDNVGNQPALVQVWADRGDEKSSPTKADAPFLITPPISRIDPAKGQSIRLIFTGEKLPADRETVFWLNVLDVPPVPKDADTNYIQLAIRSRIKLFYRPSKLPGNPDEAARGLKWSLVSQGKDMVLRAENNSAYSVSMNYAAIEVSGQQYQTAAGMVLPFGSADFVVPGLKGKPAVNSNSTVKYEAVNDYGGPVELSAQPKL